MPIDTWSYPNMLASGVAEDGLFLPFELFAGEAPITTSEGIAASNMAQFTVVARNASGQITPYAPSTADGAGTVAASGTITFSANPATNDTVTINGTVVTFVAAGASIGGPGLPSNVVIGATDVATAANLLGYIADNTVALGVNATVDSTGLIITIYANVLGTGGNAYTLAKSSSAIAVSGSTLSGGVTDSNRAAPAAKAIGILAQAAVSGSFVPYFTGGMFNHAVLIWPAGITSLAERKSVFDGSPILIGSII